MFEVRSWTFRVLCNWALALTLALVAGAAQADWPTARGNPRRAGTVDDRPGPKDPKVLWVHKAQANTVASLVPEGDRLYAATLGAFNTGVLHVFATQPDAASRIVWSKTTPFVRRPLVCAPAIVRGLVVFGDGMHQTDDSILYCVRADTGRPVWQLPVPGRLVHLEGGPTIDKDRVYIGGGDAGVLCVSLTRALLDGKEKSLEEVQSIMDKAWADLVTRYEESKKKDPDFAEPPGDDALPKVQPVVFWQQGKGVWHIDAPVAVVSDSVLAGSAYLDDEKIGKRALLCLKAEDGKTLWEVPLALNPWAGPTVAGTVALVGCSSIRFDVSKIRSAKGEVVAVNTARGKIRWRKDVPGAILSAIAVKEDLAVFTSTDGKIRACNVTTGKEAWVYDAGSPFFAGPAIAGGTVYAADLNAALHAVDLARGVRQWVLDLPDDPAVLTPGMVYGSPVVHGGQVYLATCNLEGKSAGQPGAVVCVGQSPVARQAGVGAAVAVDREKRTLSIPCRIAPRKLPGFKDTYPLEVVATFPMAQKAHETILTFEAKPSEIHRRLEELGLKPGRPAKIEGEGDPSGPEVRPYLELPDPDGRLRLIPIEEAMVDSRTGKCLPPLTWHFTGSMVKEASLFRRQAVYGADQTGTLMTIFPVSDETVFQSHLSMSERKFLRLETNRSVLPPEGTAVRLIIALDAEKIEAALFASRSAGWFAERRVAPPPFTWITAPASPAAADFPPLLGESCFPRAALEQSPRLLAHESLHPVRLRPLADTLALTVDRDPAPPARPRLPVGSPAYARAPQDAALPSASLVPEPLMPAFARDVMSEISRQTLRGAIPDFQNKPAPFVLLNVPEPLETVKAAQLSRIPPEDAPPPCRQPVPARPGFAVK